MSAGFDHLDLSNPFGDPLVGAFLGASSSAAHNAALLPSACDGTLEPTTTAVGPRGGDQDFSCFARAAMTSPLGGLGRVAMTSAPGEMCPVQEELYWDEQDIESYEMRSDASVNAQYRQLMGSRTQSMPSLPKPRVASLEPAKDASILCTKDGTLPKPGAGVRHAPATLYGGKTDMFSVIVDTTPIEYKVQFDSYMNRDKRAVHFDSYMDRDKQHLFDSCKMSSQRTCLRPSPRPVGDFRASEAWQRAYAVRERNRQTSRRRQPRQERPCVGCGPSIRMGRRARIYNPAPTPITSNEIIGEAMLEDVCRSPHPNARDVMLADEMYREQALPSTRIASRRQTPEPERRQEVVVQRQTWEHNCSPQLRQSRDMQTSSEPQLPIPVNVDLADEVHPGDVVECRRASLGQDSQLHEMQRLLGETWKQQQQQLGTVAAGAISSTSPVRFSHGDDAQRSAPPPICSDLLEVRSMPAKGAPASKDSQELANSPYVFLGRLVATLPPDAPSPQPVMRACSNEGPNAPQAVVECNFWQLRSPSSDIVGLGPPQAQRRDGATASQRTPMPEPFPLAGGGGRKWNAGRADATSVQDFDELPPWPHEM